MEYYITWDPTGEYLWTTTPYRNKKTRLWDAEHVTPENKIPVKTGTLEFFCWDCVNTAFPPNKYKLNEIEYKEILKYAIT